jgi:integrase
VFLPTDSSEPVRIPDADIKAVFEALENPTLKLFRPSAWWRVFLQMSLFLGVRRGELLGLQWSRVSFVDGSVMIHRETSKGRRDRIYEGAQSLVALLKDGFDSFDPEPSPSDAVLPWANSTYRQLYFDWDRILQAAGIPKERRFVPHNCRSKCVSELLETESSFVVKDWVGHASVTTTKKHYAKTKKARRDVAKKRKVRQ